MTEEAMMLIMHSGSARSFAFEAIEKAKQKDIQSAEQLLEECKNEINSAHKIQTQLIQDEAKGEAKDITLLMIHAQDHLMTSMLMKDLCSEFIDIYKKI